MADAELKPCPFCGGAVELERTTGSYEKMHGQREWWGVVCRNTINVGGTCAIQQVPSASKEAAVERWNCRATHPTEAGAPTVAVELHRKFVAIITGATSLGENRVYDLADALVKEAGRESAASVAQQDAKDAARWQWLRKQHNSGDEQWFVYGATSADLDADIDDVMQKGGVDNV